jgi:hypothetical protein
MTNESNMFGVLKVQNNGNGNYLRIPAAAAKLMHVRKGDTFRAHVSTDRKSIRFIKVIDPLDIINIDDPCRPEPQHIIVEPAELNRLSRIIQNLFGGK